MFLHVWMHVCMDASCMSCMYGCICGCKYVLYVWVFVYMCVFMYVNLFCLGQYVSLKRRRKGIKCESYLRARGIFPFTCYENVIWIYLRLYTMYLYKGNRGAKRLRPLKIRCRLGISHNLNVNAHVVYSDCTAPRSSSFFIELIDWDPSPTAIRLSGSRVI